MSRILILPALAATIATLSAAPREEAWKQVAESYANDQPKTVLKLLQPIESAAFADHAWGEGARALLMRVRLQNGVGFPADPLPEFAKPPPPDNQESDPFANPATDPFATPSHDTGEPGGLPGCIRQLDTEITTAPAEVRPVLRWFQARWLSAYFQQRGHDFDSRSALNNPTDNDLKTWDSTRFKSEIDKFFQQALAEKETLQKLPVAAFREVLAKPGCLGDSLRPTLYDLIAHSALEYFMGDDNSRFDAPDDPLPIPADSPVFDGTDAFLAWHPDTPDTYSPNSRSLHIYQELLAFHRDDPDRTAFLHCDLERLRWAGRAATGRDKTRRHATAIQAFIAANAAHPLSADARQDDICLFLQADKPRDAHDSAVAGAKAFPKHPFGKMCRQIADEMEAKVLHLGSPLSWAPSGDEITVIRKNLSHVWFRLYPMKWRVNLNSLEHDPCPKSKRALAGILKNQPARAWDVALPDPADFREHESIVNSPQDLQPGYYLLVVSGTENFTGKNAVVAWTGVHVSNLGVILDHSSGNPGVYNGFVVDAVSGAPAPGAIVDIWQERDETKTLVKQQTHADANGVFQFTPQLPPQQEGKSRSFGLLVAANDGGHPAVARTNYQKRQPSPPDPSQHVTFFTDRAIYRPGQTIHFKGILWDGDRNTTNYHTVAGHTVTVSFKDNNNKEIAHQELVTNDMGSFAGTFTAPTNPLLGAFEIAAGNLGSTSIHIEEYKRPKFQVEFPPLPQPASLGAKVEVKVVARAFTGAPVDGARVVWNVKRATYWTGAGAWRDLSQNHGDLKIASGTGVTAADGSLNISFVAEPDESLDPDMDPVFEYQVSATVTDQTGEQKDESCEFDVGYTAFCAKVTVEPWQEEGKPVTFKVTTQTHDLVAFPAQGTLRIYQVRQPDVCPRMEKRRGYGDWSSTTPMPGPTGWESGELMKELPVTTRIDEGCIAKVSAALPAGLYRAIFESRDANQRKVQDITQFKVVNPQADRFPIKSPLFVEAPEWKCEPGQPITLLWGSGFETARACVEWFRDDTLLKREWSAAGRTQQVFTFTPDESLRGGFNVRVLQFSMNRLNTFAQRISVPWSNKELTLRWEHLTSKLAPGAKDTWAAVVKGPDGTPATTEMVATLYDASLDDIVWHGFGGFDGWFRSDSYLFHQYADSATNNWFFYSGNVRSWDALRGDAWAVITQPFRLLATALDGEPQIGAISLSERGRFAIMVDPSGKGDTTVLLVGPPDPYEPPQLPQSVGATNSGPASFASFPVTPATPTAFGGSSSGDDARSAAEQRALTLLAPRKNLQETAFFYPYLTSNDKGEVRITFTMPEALTKWRFLGFAHDKDLRCGKLDGETVTAQDLMVQPNAPRFLREGDVLDFTVKISNQSDSDQSGTARLTLADAATLKDVTRQLGITAPDQAWTIPAKESRTLSWRITVPDGCGFLTYKALATTGNLSDGEEYWLPVIPRKVMLTESLALPVRDAGTRNFKFQNLLDSGKSGTLEHRFVEVQAVSQPAWYAVLALPYLMEFPHECAEQTFNRYYANALAKHLVNSNPKIRRIFELWKNTPAPESPLTKNADIKGILLEETPWLNEATNQSQARHQLGLLFDDNQLGEQLETAMNRTRDLQGRDGLWPWFPGGHGNEYISLYIATGFARLRAMGVETDITPALNALPQLDAGLTKSLGLINEAAKKDPKILDANHLDSWVAHHLYTRTFFLKDRAIERADKEAFDYFAAQAKKFWPGLDSRMSRAHAALALARLGDMDTARLITRSLKEHALNNEETGMSWTDPSNNNWWWWQAPIETQAMMIEAFREIDHDAQSVDACQVWLIKQLQARHWPSTKATADAVAALLAGGADLLGSDALLQVSLGGVAVKPDAVEPGTGFYQNRIAGPAVKPAMGNIQITKTDPGTAWASIHWQYLEDIGKITAHNATPLKLEKSLFVRTRTAQGPRLEAVTGPVKVGDELVTRLVLRNDRDMEFIHLKDQRGSGTEPVNVLSGYRWQDGFGYYETTRDSASHFFIDILPAGTHVFETSVRVQHAGIYQTGVAEIRCMYAPEFNAHSASVRLEVGK